MAGARTSTVGPGWPGFHDRTGRGCSEAKVVGIVAGGDAAGAAELLRAGSRLSRQASDRSTLPWVGQVGETCVTCLVERQRCQSASLARMPARQPADNRGRPGEGLRGVAFSRNSDFGRIRYAGPLQRARASRDPPWREEPLWPLHCREGDPSLLPRDSSGRVSRATEATGIGATRDIANLSQGSEPDMMEADRWPLQPPGSDLSASHATVRSGSDLSRTIAVRFSIGTSDLV